MKDRVIGITTELVTPILQQEEAELVDVEYKKEGADWFLRVYVDKPGGIDIDTCTRISERLSAALDRRDPIAGPYILEVSSPGAERPLKRDKDWQAAIGKKVLLTLYQPVEGSKEHVGTLVSKDEHEVKLEQGNQTIAIPCEKIAHARLTVFP